MEKKSHHTAGCKVGVARQELNQPRLGKTGKVHGKIQGTPMWPLSLIPPSPKDLRSRRAAASIPLPCTPSASHATSAQFCPYKPFLPSPPTHALPAPSTCCISAGFLLSSPSLWHSPGFPASQCLLTFRGWPHPKMSHPHSLLPLHISLGSYKRQVAERVGAFSPWFPAVSLWPCWPLWVSEHLHPSHCCSPSCVASCWQCFILQSFLC